MLNLMLDMWIVSSKLLKQFELHCVALNLIGIQSASLYCKKCTTLCCILMLRMIALASMYGLEDIIQIFPVMAELISTFCPQRFLLVNPN